LRYPNIDDFDYSELDLFADEYKAFLTPLKQQKEDEDFVTHHKTSEWKSILKKDLPDELSSIVMMVDSLVIATRLREIQIFRGFYRVSAEDKDNFVPPDIVGSSNSWLPAIELFGEGLFFSIREEVLSEWEHLEGVGKRADEIKNRYNKSDVYIFQEFELSPRFILLHTLAHLIIRELESTAGYPAASLSERIYCSKDQKMAGVLIYTTVADIAGSLGGIIKSAEPRSFLSILEGTMKKAQWCSLDPVCSELEGQGPGWLNRAACHACSLVPEPSCDFGNVFLDRVLIKGSSILGIPSFSDFVLEVASNRKGK
jgi:hypothetical protein